MQKELNLDRAIGEIGRRLKDHIGSNGSAHLPVSKDFNGFMTPELLSKFNELFAHRVYLPDNTDILSLGPGYYEGAKLLNHPAQPSTPTGWISNIDVTCGDNGRKQIKIQDNLAGNVFERTIHSDGNANSGTQGWGRVFREQIIWDGYSKMTSPVTLALPLKNTDGTSRYDKIKIIFQTDFDNRNLAIGSYKGVTIDASNLNNDNNVAAINVAEAQVEFPTIKTAVVTRNRFVNIFKSEGSDNVSRMTIGDPVINICQIIGVY